MSFDPRKTDRVALSGFALLAVLTVTEPLSLGGKVAVSAVLFLGAAVAAAVTVKTRRAVAAMLALMLLVAAAGGGVRCLRDARDAEWQARIPSEPVHVEGTVCDLPTYDGRFRYPIRLTSIDGADAQGMKIELTSRKELDGDLGDAFSGDLQLTACRKTDGTLAYASRAPGKTVRFTAQGSGARYALSRFRRGLLRQLDELFDGDTQAVAKAVLLADTSDLDESLSDAFRDCGISHLIVVSGMHLSIVTGLFLQLFRLLTRRRRQVFTVLTAIPVLAFLAICGFAPSVLRAGIAALAMLVGAFFDEKVGGYTALGWSILILGFAAPTVVTSPGFLLSVAATAGLYGMGLGWHRRWKESYYRRHRRGAPKLLSGVLLTVFCSVGAQLATLPLAVVYFDRVSLVGIPANFAVSPAVDAVLICGVPALLCMAVGLTPLGAVLGVPTGLAARAAAAVVRTLGALPGITVPVWGQWTALCALVATALMLVALLRDRLRAGAIAVACVIAVCAAGNVSALPATRVLVTDSGCFVAEGDALCAIGFDGALRVTADVRSATRLFGRDRFETVVWETAGNWETVLKSCSAESIVTSQPVPGALPIDRVLAPPLTLTAGNVTYDCRGTYTLVHLPGATLCVAAVPLDPEMLPEADLTVIPNRDADGWLTPTVIRDGGLAKSGRTVYNETAKDLVLTVGRTGRIAVETR